MDMMRMDMIILINQNPLKQVMIVILVIYHIHDGDDVHANFIQL